VNWLFVYYDFIIMRHMSFWAKIISHELFKANTKEMPIIPKLSMHYIRWPSKISTAFLLLAPVVAHIVVILENQIWLGFIRGLCRLADRAILDEATLDSLIYLSPQVPNSCWNTSSMFLFSFAEHWMNPQKSLSLANSFRNFLVWCCSGF
jgi:hypothetical protein